MEYFSEIISIVSGIGLFIAVFASGSKTGSKITQLQSDLSEGQTKLRGEFRGSLEDNSRRIEKKIDDENRLIKTGLEDMNAKFTDLRLEMALETVKKAELSEVKNEVNGNLRSYGGEIMLLRDRIVRIETKQELKE